MERRLAAILAADVVGFSALVGRDEGRTLTALKAHTAVLQPMIGLHAGRIFKFTGDGFLAEFGSVVDAVSCADALQKRMAERNMDEPEDTRLDFRMGIHTGDVVVDGDDMLGDGVNIAARLEAIAKPGGIALNPAASVLHRYIAVASSELGRPEDTAKALARAMELAPGFKTRDFIKYLSNSVKVADALWKSYETVLIRAGFPE